MWCTETQNTPIFMTYYCCFPVKIFGKVFHHLSLIFFASVKVHLSAFISFLTFEIPKKVPVFILLLFYKYQQQTHNLCSGLLACICCCNNSETVKYVERHCCIKSYNITANKKSLKGYGHYFLTLNDNYLQM